ncbi:hypothetical protein Tco_0635478 [Tanacetum coccineum]
MELSYFVDEVFNSGLVQVQEVVQQVQSWKHVYASKGVILRNGLNTTVTSTNPYRKSYLTKCYDDDLRSSPEVRAKLQGLIKIIERLGKGKSAAYFLEKCGVNIRRERKASRHVLFIQQHPKGSSEGSGVTSEVPDELVFKSSNEGAGVTLKVPDEPSDYSSSSWYDSEFGVKDISSDEAEVIEKANNAKIVDAKKDTKDQVAEEQGAERQPGNKELGAYRGDNEPACDAQADKFSCDSIFC